MIRMWEIMKMLKFFKTLIERQQKGEDIQLHYQNMVLNLVELIE